MYILGADPLREQELLRFELKRLRSADQPIRLGQFDRECLQIVGLEAPLFACDTGVKRDRAVFCAQCL